MFLEHRPPLFNEFLPVYLLVFLDPAGYVCAAGNAFEVDDHGQRLIHDLVSHVSEGETEVGIFTICGLVSLVEAAHFLKQVSLHHKRSAGAVINWPDVAVFGLQGVVSAAVVPACAVVPYYSAGFL